MSSAKTKRKEFSLKAILAIDPGARGGVVAITEDGIIECLKCPDSADKMSLIISYIINECHIKNYNLIAYIENVHAFPTDARSSAFKFGRNYGIWLGILAANNIAPIKVAPQKWQKSYHPLSKIKKDRKKELHQIASDMFTKVKVTYLVCDALLIAAYGMSYDKN